MAPKFQHDCKKCNFLGHFLGFDVYTCVGTVSTSIIARDGNEPSEYASMPLDMFKDMIERNVDIGQQHGPTIKYHQHLLDGGYHSAWVLALACQK